jgi:hypothetical protein
MIEQFISVISDGPRGSAVNQVDVSWAEGKQVFRDFQIVY